MMLWMTTKFLSVVLDDVVDDHKVMDDHKVLSVVQNFGRINNSNGQCSRESATAEFLWLILTLV